MVVGECYEVVFYLFEFDCEVGVLVGVDCVCCCLGGDFFGVDDVVGEGL